MLNNSFQIVNRNYDNYSNKTPDKCQRFFSLFYLCKSLTHFLFLKYLVAFYAHNTKNILHNENHMLLFIQTNGLYMEVMKLRTKHPEKTAEKVLDVARELFFKKGYDNTTMQDIIDHGLSKGAIYHHFKSKQEIFEVIMQQVESTSTMTVSTGSNSLEKLRNLLFVRLHDEERIKMLKNARSLFLDPKVFGEIYFMNMQHTVPMIESIIEEGNRDTSMNCQYPKQAAKEIVYFFSIWIGMLLYDITQEDLKSNINYYKDVFDFSGIPLLDATLINEIENYYKKIVQVA